MFDAELHQLIEDMAETMYSAPGVGLAAPQIWVSKRLFIVDVATDEDEPSDLRVFINPEIIATEGETTFNEGCLSFPRRPRGHRPRRAGHGPSARQGRQPLRARG